MQRRLMILILTAALSMQFPFLVSGSERNAAEQYINDSREVGNQVDSGNRELKDGWYYENGCKLFYKSGKMQTDLRKLVTGPYRVVTNCSANVITVYAKDGSNGYIIPVVNFVCSTGAILDGYTSSTGGHTHTPLGTYTLLGKDDWHYFVTWDDYVRYAIRFKKGGFFFHSISYTDSQNESADYYNQYAPFTLHEEKYNTLGQNDSHGCIRMQVADVKWMYENSKKIEEFYFHESVDYGPYPKPEAKPIGKVIKHGETFYYDPTDEDALRLLEEFTYS